eukprot:ANDGO_02096.mRNA.1 hypothetical protein
MTTARLCFAVLFLLFLHSIDARLSADKQHRCGSCRAMAEEMAEVVDHKITDLSSIDVGHRLKDRGYHKLPYRESAVFAHDVLHETCAGLKHYARSGPLYVKIQGHRFGSGSASVNLTNATIDSKVAKELENRCYTLVEEFEDEILAVLKDVVSLAVARQKEAEKLGEKRGPRLDPDHLSLPICNAIIHQECWTVYVPESSGEGEKERGRESDAQEVKSDL